MGIIDSGKELLKLAEAYRNTEIYQKVVDLQGQIVELSGDKVAMHERLLKANERIRTLEDEAAFTKTLTLRDEMYWAGGDPLPYCMKCLEGSKKRLHLTRGTISGYYCVTCRDSFGDRFYKWENDEPSPEPDREIV